MRRVIVFGMLAIFIGASVLPLCIGKISVPPSPLGSPDIWVDPASFNISAQQGNVLKKQLLIGNDGTDSLEFSIEIIGDVVYSTNFTTKPVDWTITKLSGPAWEWKYEKMVHFDSYPVISAGYLDSPVINCSGRDTVFVSFRHWWGTEIFSGPVQDGYIRGSIDGGVTWPYLLDEFHHQNPSSEKGMKVYSLPWATHQPNVQIRFDIYDYAGDLWVIDDFKVYESWLSSTPTLGTLQSGEDVSVDIVFNTTGLECGTYAETVIISSNDPDEPTIVIPVTLHVLSPPSPEITGALSVKDHEDYGDFYIDVFVGDIEHRWHGPTLLQIHFDQPLAFTDGMSLDDVVVSSGVVEDLSIDGSLLTIALHDVSNAEYLVISFPGIESLAGVGVIDQLTVGVLSGDVTGDGVVDGVDIAGIRGPGNWNKPLGEVADPRCDINCDGMIDGLDISSIRGPGCWLSALESQ